MTRLASRYLGIDLQHPIVASASPITASFDGMRRLEDAGAAAIVTATLCEEETRAADAVYAILTEASASCNAEAVSYFPELPRYHHGVSGHLEMVRRSAEALDIPVIASLNGASDEGWVESASQLEEAGAAALELKVSLASDDLTLSGPEVERRYLDVVRCVKGQVKIPVSIKLPPFFTALGNFVTQLQSAGADGAVLFERCLAGDIDLETLSVKPAALLSQSAEERLPLTWIALLSRRVNLSLAAGTGVDTSVEVVKYLLAGADVVMTTSALLRHGAGHVTALVLGLENWLSENGFASVAEIRGRLDATQGGRADAFFQSHHRYALADELLRHSFGPGLTVDAAPAPSA